VDEGRWRISRRFEGYTGENFKPNTTAAYVVNFHGIYGGIDKLGPRLVVEPYAIWRLEHGLRNEENVISKLNEKVGGIRIVGKQLLGSSDYGTEMVREFGSLGQDKIQSWAGHWGIGDTLKGRFTPRVYGEYNFASGNQNVHDGFGGTFDQLYRTGDHKDGLRR